MLVAVDDGQDDSIQRGNHPAQGPTSDLQDYILIQIGRQRYDPRDDIPFRQACFLADAGRMASTSAPLV